MMRLVVVAALLTFSTTARADELVTDVEVRVVKTAEAELGKIEKALRSQPGINAGAVQNITLPLQTAIEEDLGKGPVKLYPRALYEACLAKLKKGEAREAIAKELVDLHRRGDLAKASGDNSAGPKKVASFVFDKERVRYPDPHLPSNVKGAPGEKLKGIYQICVGVDGKVTKVTTVQSIAGADQTVIEQIQSSWIYKPQPVPVCTQRAFVFTFN